MDKDRTSDDPQRLLAFMDALSSLRTPRATEPRTSQVPTPEEILAAQILSEPRPAQGTVVETDLTGPYT